MRIFLCFLAALICEVQLFAQSSVREAWVRNYNSGRVPADDSAVDIVADHAGNIYVAGRSHQPDTGYDYLVVKYDASGQQQWVARYDGPAYGEDRVSAMAVDSMGNVFVTGQSTSFTRSDFATVKYNPDGIEQWAARYDGPAHGSDIASDLAVDRSGNVYVTGRSEGVGTAAGFRDDQILP